MWMVLWSFSLMFVSLISLLLIILLIFVLVVTRATLLSILGPRWASALAASGSLLGLS